MTEARAATGKPGCLVRLMAMVMLWAIIPLLLLLAAELGLRMAGVGESTRFLLEKRSPDGARFHVPNRAYYQQFSHLPIDTFLNWDHLDFLVEAEKAPEAFRIFAFGGSAIYGTFSPPRLLEIMLQETYPELRFEVFNAACPGMNSHVMAPAAKAAAALRPDCFLIYMGNNEALGPYGPSTPLARIPRLWHVPVIRALIALRDWRLVQWLRPIQPQPAEKPGDEALRQMIPRVTDDARANEHHRINLEAMCGHARAGGAQTVVCTLARNWRFGEASEPGSAAPAVPPARGATNENILAAAEARDDVYLADVERMFMESAPGGVPGYDFFVDNIHFNFHGSYLVARELFGQVSAVMASRGVLPENCPRTPPTEEACAALLGFLAPAQYLLIAHQLRVIVDPKSRERLEISRDNWRAQFEGAPEARWIQDLAAALTRRPGDWRLRHQLVELLQAGGHHEEALEEASILYAHEPRLRVALRARAQTLVAVGRIPEARAALGALLRLYPCDIPGQHLARQLAAGNQAS